MGGVLFSSAYLLGQAGFMSSATNHNAGYFKKEMKECRISLEMPNL